MQEISALRAEFQQSRSEYSLSATLPASSSLNSVISEASRGRIRLKRGLTRHWVSSDNEWEG